jgi:NAD(P)-dependent dehydrogenase (short-subunit alcohol dehydrogenase family)
MEISSNGLGVIITAGASGIGLSIAKKFVANGANVHVGDINEQFLTECKASLPGVETSLCDVSDASQVKHMFTEALDHMGKLHVLVNGAGITGPTARIEDVLPDDWDKTIAVNLNGQFYCSREAIPLIKASGGGAIVNISSCSGLMGSPFRSPYCAAKWGIIGMTKTMAMELGEFGIRVNAICPGIVEGSRMACVIATDAKHKGTTEEEVREMYKACVSMKTFVTPDDVADMILFLCSKAGSKISGQAIGIDGNIEILR